MRRVRHSIRSIPPTILSARDGRKVLGPMIMSALYRRQASCKRYRLGSKQNLHNQDTIWKATKPVHHMKSKGRRARAGARSYLRIIEIVALLSAAQQDTTWDSDSCALPVSRNDQSAIALLSSCMRMTISTPDLMCQDQLLGLIQLMHLHLNTKTYTFQASSSKWLEHIYS